MKGRRKDQVSHDKDEVRRKKEGIQEGLSRNLDPSPEAERKWRRRGRTEAPTQE